MCRLAFATLVALAACAPAARPAGAPAPVRLTNPEIEQIATLLRLEDRRELDTAALSSLAAAPSATVRRYTAAAVGRIGGTGSDALLLPLLADRDTSVAATAAFALGQLGDTVATPA
ncbi:MAG TPA: HEAT repeat domain-containing protein, partial [Longimicrobiaceae bacterium]|nr:HEAT repeat domain-containing protein [Longimicrobiaceae bacterium]